MKIFGRYLWYRLNNSALRTLVFAFLSVGITQLTVAECIGRMNVKNNETGIYILAIILGIFCTVIPILEMSGFKNRRNLDTLYFFPIKREKMALAHYVSGFIQVIFIYTVTFFSAYIHLALQTNYFELWYLAPYYFLSILIGFVMYSLFMFIFTQANTVADGVLFCGLWILLLFVLMTVVNNEMIIPLIDEKDYKALRLANHLPNWGIAYAPINNLTVIFQDLIEVNKNGENYFADIYRGQIYMFFVWGAVGIAAAVGYFITFLKKGAEKAGEISDSWFGYRILIPVYGYCLLILIGDIELISILVFALMIIGYVIYRRGFRLKTSDLVISALGILVLFLGSIL